VTTGPKRVVNLADVPLNDAGNGKSFQARIGRIGPMLGLAGLGCTVTVVPPGKRAYPFHRHHVFSELFYVVSGTGEVRLDARVLPVRAGDLIACPAGAEAHQIVNTGRDELRYLAISDMAAVDVGVKNGDLTTASYKALGRVTPADYFDGEEPAEPRVAKGGSRP